MPVGAGEQVVFQLEGPGAEVIRVARTVIGRRGCDGQETEAKGKQGDAEYHPRILAARRLAHKKSGEQEDGPEAKRPRRGSGDGQVTINQMRQNALGRGFAIRVVVAVVFHARLFEPAGDHAVIDDGRIAP